MNFTPLTLAQVTHAAGDMQGWLIQCLPQCLQKLLQMVDFVTKFSAICTLCFITVVYKVIEYIIKDEGFSVPSPSAITAKETASLLMRYCKFPNFPTLFIEFSNELSSTLAQCFVQKRSLNRRKKACGDIIICCDPWPHFMNL